MKKFIQSHTANKCWSFNSVTDFSNSKIHISEVATLDLGPEERAGLAQHCMENKPKPSTAHQSRTGWKQMVNSSKINKNSVIKEQFKSVRTE